MGIQGTLTWLKAPFLSKFDSVLAARLPALGMHYGRQGTCLNQYTAGNPGPTSETLSAARRPDSTNIVLALGPLVTEKKVTSKSAQDDDTALYSCPLILIQLLSQTLTHF